jgi:hypothetical protein
MLYQLSYASTRADSYSIVPVADNATPTGTPPTLQLPCWKGRKDYHDHRSAGTFLIIRREIRPGQTEARRYTEPVSEALLQGRKSWLAAALLVVLVAGAGGWWLGTRRSGPARLLARLPGENLLLLYADFAQARQTRALEPLIRSQVATGPDYAAFVRETGFDYQRDLDAAAVAYLPDRVYVVAQGRFDPTRLRQYAVAQGGGCTGPALDRPCWMPAFLPGRKISFLLLDPSLLALATAPEQDAVLGLAVLPPPTAESLGQAVAALNPRRALVWLTASPAGLDQVFRQASSPNLALFAQPLATAQRVYLFVNDRSPNLEISLQAVCASEAQAAEMRQLLQGLHNFMGGLLRGGRGTSKPPAEWERVLASAVIEQKAGTVHASWTLDSTVLETLGSAAR